MGILNAPAIRLMIPAVTILTQDEIIRLSPPERLTLIGDLWDSLGAADVPLSGAQTAELGRRLATFDRDLPHATSWTDLKAELAARKP